MEKRLKEATGVTLWALDDTYERHYCDILLNHNISADAKRYRGLVPKHCELRCGVEYTLLRDEFYEVKSEPKTRSEKFRILISMGGVDSANLNIDILKVLGHYLDIVAEVVTSTANENLEELKEYVADKDWIVLHIDTDRMARLMKLCDFAIVTPSVTVNEVIFMDLPFLAVKIADNQNEVYRYLKSHGYDVCIYRKENKLSFLKGLENVILQRVGK
jgi:UDP-2,4-diacetamido-2,4,6-trideoxy-beta-L-altropyranose hydrolase